MPLEDIWNKSLTIIEKKVGENAFELWFKPIKLSQLKDQSAVLEIPNRFFKDWVEDYYPTLITDTMEEIVGHPVTLKFKIAEKEDSEVKRIDARLEGRKQRLASKGIYLNPKYTFSNFVRARAISLPMLRQWQWQSRWERHIIPFLFTGSGSREDPSYYRHRKQGSRQKA